MSCAFDAAAGVRRRDDEDRECRASGRSLRGRRARSTKCRRTRRRCGRSRRAADGRRRSARARRVRVARLVGPVVEPEAYVSPTSQRTRSRASGIVAGHPVAHVPPRFRTRRPVLAVPGCRRSSRSGSSPRCTCTGRRCTSGRRRTLPHEPQLFVGLLLTHAPAQVSPGAVDGADIPVAARDAAPCVGPGSSCRTATRSCSDRCQDARVAAGVGAGNARVAARRAARARGGRVRRRGALAARGADSAVVRDRCWRRTSRLPVPQRWSLALHVKPQTPPGRARRRPPGRQGTACCSRRSGSDRSARPRRRRRTS